MSKCVKTFIAVAAMLAVATPAMADFKFSGLFRVQGYTQTAQDIGRNDARSVSVVDQRFRPKVDYKLNDYVSLTYFAEVDTTWGRQSKGDIGGGGQVGSDGVNLETKNIYVDFKVPDSTHNIRLGIQGIKDAFNGVVFFDDMAAAKFSGKFGPVDYQAFYSKWSEGNIRLYDDVDFYGVDFSHRYGDFAKAGIAAYYYDNNSGNGILDDQGDIVDPIPALGEGTNLDAEMWWVGFYGDYRFGNFGLDGFLIYQTGEVLLDPVTNNYIDSEAWAGSVKGRMVIPNGDLGLRYIFYSADDSATDADRFFLSQGNFEFADENLMIFLVDPLVNNVAKTRFAIAHAAEGGYGLHGLAFSGNFKNLPMNTYAKVGAGAFFAADKNPKGAERVDDATLGYEVAARIGKVFAEKFDVSLRGSYAFIGDFYKTPAVGTPAHTTSNDPDDIYMAAIMVNVPF